MSVPRLTRRPAEAQASQRPGVAMAVIMYLHGPRGLSPIHASLLLVPGYVLGLGHRHYLSSVDTPASRKAGE